MISTRDDVFMASPIGIDLTPAAAGIEAVERSGLIDRIVEIMERGSISLPRDRVGQILAEGRVSTDIPCASDLAFVLIPGVGRVLRLRLLGEGAEKAAYLGVNLETGHSLVMATAKSIHLAGKLEREVSLMQRAAGPGVMPVTGCFRTESDLPCVVMPFAEEGDLSIRGSLPFAAQKREIAELATMIVALHARGVTHCDIKADNFFISQGRPLLADFGQAIPKEEGNFLANCKRDTRCFAVMAIFLLTANEAKSSLDDGFAAGAPSSIRAPAYRKAIDGLTVSEGLKEIFRRIDATNRDTYPRMEELEEALRKEADRDEATPADI